MMHLIVKLRSCGNPEEAKKITVKSYLFCPTFFMTEVICWWGPAPWHAELLRWKFQVIFTQIWTKLNLQKSHRVSLNPIIIRAEHLQEFVWSEDEMRAITSVARSGMVGWPAGALPEFWAPISLSSIDLEQENACSSPTLIWLHFNEQSYSAQALFQIFLSFRKLTLQHNVSLSSYFAHILLLQTLPQ